MPSDKALDRVSRLLDLIPFLSNQEGNLSELALKLGIEEGQLQRDLEIAFLCGLPGYTPDLLIDISFDDSSIAVTNPQSLGIPRRMSDGERAALLLGLNRLELQFIGIERIQETIRSIRSKLLTPIETLSEVIAVDPVLKEKIACIETSIAEDHRISFSYLDTQGSSSRNRNLSPWRLLSRRGQMVVRGFDHDRGAPRDFLLNRMSDVAAVDGAYEPEIEYPIENAKLAVVVLTKVPLWWRRRNSSLIDDVKISQEGFEVRISYWRRGTVIFSVLPVVDLLMGFKSEEWSEDEFRRDLLSHFRG